MFVTRKVFLKYRDLETGGEGSTGGGGVDDAAAAAAAKAKAEAEAAAAAASGEGARKTSDEEARLLKENMQKKEALRKKDEEIAALKKSVEGLDLDAVRKLLAEQKTAEEKALEAKGDYERLKARMAEEHAKEIKTLKDQLAQEASERAKLAGNINELSIGSQFAQSKFIADELTLTPAKARVIYADHFDLEDGKVVGYDKPRGAANRTALVDQYGTPVAFDQALAKIVDLDPDKDHLIKSKVKAGAGSQTSRASGVQKQEVPADGISKISAGLKALKSTS
jgi:hypothetical protein